MNLKKNRVPDLSVIIPVFNAESSLARVVSDFLSISDIDIQVLLVDDFSTDASTEIAQQLAQQHDQVFAFFHEQNRGAGIARNTAFQSAAGKYTIFFDADDFVEGRVIREALTGIEKTASDVAMMPYFYKRDETSEYDAMNLNDAKVWNRVLNGKQHLTATLDEVPSLLGFSNYPWNKIVLTERYKEIGLKFGSTAVNNDILGHWYSLLFARKIYLLDQEVCTHVVVSSGSNLTNQHSKVRLQLFDALDETYDLLESSAPLRSRYAHHYWSLAVRTTNWARSRINDQLRPEFNSRCQEHLMRINLDDFSRMRQKRTPNLAEEILRLSLV